MTIEQSTTPRKILTQGMRSGKDTAKARFPLWAAIFIIGLIIPLFIFLGPLRLSIYRIVLLLMFLPMIYLLLSGKIGRIRLPDIFVILICIWSSLSFIVLHGLSAMSETIGILWIETLGAYLVGRCFIRTPEDFLMISRLLFRICLFMIPFALYELYTGTSILIRIFDAIGPAYSEHAMEKRLGFERVQGPFAHAIHFGVFFGALVGLVYFVIGYGRSWFERIRNTSICVFLCFCSLSAGPLAAAMTQIYLLLWNGVLKKVKMRWNILAGLSILAYIVIDLISNRTPFHVFISYVAFNASTAYHRIRIWIYGTQNIWENPIFGIGMNDWERPYWMVPSIDMFWIVPAMRHGVLVWALWLGLFFWIFCSIANRPKLGDRMQWYRMGYLFSMAGIFISGWTVHYWDATYVFLMFFMGFGIWILDWTEEVDEEEPQKEFSDETTPYSRFPVRRREEITARSSKND